MASQKGLDFKHKEVINITDGRKLGFVQDVTADLESGTITSIIVPGSSKPFNLFQTSQDIVGAKFIVLARILFLWKFNIAKSDVCF